MRSLLGGVSVLPVKKVHSVSVPLPVPRTPTPTPPTPPADSEIIKKLEAQQDEIHQLRQEIQSLRALYSDVAHNMTSLTERVVSITEAPSVKLPRSESPKSGCDVIGPRVAFAAQLSQAQVVSEGEGTSTEEIESISTSKGHTIECALDLTDEVLDSCNRNDMRNLCEFFDLEIPPKAKKAKIHSILKTHCEEESQRS